MQSKYIDNNFKTKNYNNKQQNSSGMWTALATLAAAAVSSVVGMATAKKQNKFNADQAEISRDYNSLEAQKTREWNLQMDNTKYQRQVADMQAAGINPALAMNGGVTTQATSNATASSSPAQGAMANIDLGSAVMMMSKLLDYKIQKKELAIQRDIADSQIRKNNADAQGKETENKYADEYNQLRNQGMELVNQVNESQVKQINANLEKIGAEVDKLRKEAATEEERRMLTISERTLKDSMAKLTDEQRKQIVGLLPYQQKLMSAQTENQKAQASFALIQAAYQQGLIDNNYIDAIVRETNNKADESEARKISTEIQNNLNTGRWFPDKGIGNKVANAFLAAAPAVSKVVGALSPIKFAMGQ